MNGTQLPYIHTPIPGPGSQALVDQLAAHECPAITARRTRRAERLNQTQADPVVWSSGIGSNVSDVDGNRFVDMTAGFGVALVGHRHPKIVEAATTQANQLIHAMGDAYPDATRIRFLKALADLAPGDLSVSILGLSGSDAIDACIKTAKMATGKSGILAFTGAYHGLALGVLGLQAYQPTFTAPFSDMTHGHVHHLSFGCDMDEVIACLREQNIGLVLVEPIQGRGGMRTAPEGWLSNLAKTARLGGAIFAVDEIQTGLGRTGSLFATSAEGVIPDLLCIGKALGGGFPLSACMGSPTTMNHWAPSMGEAIHTQTFLGHPIACHTGLAVLDIIGREHISETCAELGGWICDSLAKRGLQTTGRGLMLGIKLPCSSLSVSRSLLKMGYIALPTGSKDDMLGLTPPAVITKPQLNGFMDALMDAIKPV
jgi:4-aminobutyrate aminotransferase/(S)-3-amino-2-methylpropionate transaminase